MLPSGWMNSHHLYLPHIFIFNNMGKTRPHSQQRGAIVCIIEGRMESGTKSDVPAKITNRKSETYHVRK